MDGILSQEPTVARHALALALHLAQHNSPQLLEAQKDLTTVVAATCGVYEASGERCSASSIHGQLSLLTSAAFWDETAELPGRALPPSAWSWSRHPSH